MTESAIIAVAVTVVISLISYFLIKIHQSFEETQRDVKQLLINGGKRDAQLNELQADIHTLAIKNDDHDKRLQRVEITVSKI